MAERVYGAPARMRVALKPQRRGRPVATQTSGLRERAWWLMRQLPRFTLDELLLTLADGSERDAYGNLRKYVKRLERVGVLARLHRRASGTAPTSNGLVIWRLARDLGRVAPVWRGTQGALWDPNTSALLYPPPHADDEPEEPEEPQEPQEQEQEAQP